MLSDSDISALMNSQFGWETSEYALAFIVAAACFGEFVHEFTPWFKLCLLVLVAALVFEIPTQFKVNSISGTIIAAVEERAEDARLREARLERLVSWRHLEGEQIVSLRQFGSRHELPTMTMSTGG